MITLKNKIQNLPYLDPGLVNPSTDFIVTENITTGKTSKVRLNKVIPQNYKVFNWFNKNDEISPGNSSGYINIEYTIDDEVVLPNAKSLYVSWQKDTHNEDKAKKRKGHYSTAHTCITYKRHDNDTDWATRTGPGNTADWIQSAYVWHSYGHGSDAFIPIVQSETDSLKRAIYMRFYNGSSHAFKVRIHAFIM